MTPDVEGHRLPAAQENGPGAVWKWLTAFMAGAILTGAPSYALLLSKPSDEQLDIIEQRVNDLRIDNAHLTEQVLALQQEITSLRNDRFPR